MENIVKKWIDHSIDGCAIDLVGWRSGIYFHEVELGDYNGIIRQYYLELHKGMIDYYEKKIECVDNEGVIRNIIG
jgi:hypothetical protein